MNGKFFTKMINTDGVSNTNLFSLQTYINMACLSVITLIVHISVVIGQVSGMFLLKSAIEGSECSIPFCKIVPDDRHVHVG